MNSKLLGRQSRILAKVSVMGALSLVSCNLASSLTPSPRPKTQESNSERVGTDAASLPLADAACQESEGNRTLGTQEFWSLNGETVAPTTTSFSQAAADGAEGLRGGAVGATLFGHQELVTKECMEPGPGVKPDCRITSEKVINSGSPLHLCKKDFSYPRTSLEGAAISTFAAVEKSAEVFTKEFSSSPKAAPVWIVMLPQLKTHYVATRFSGEKVSATYLRLDNAFWALANGKTSSGTQMKTGIISVLPPSKDFQRDNGNGVVGLWEVPFVVAHEYGHHVFFSKIENLEPVLNSGHIIDDEERTFEKKFVESNFPAPLSQLRRFLAAPAKPMRAVTVADAVQSLNEGFADLFGELVFPSGSATMKVLPGVCTNRDIARDTFLSAGQQSAKSLDSFQLELFLSSELEEEQNSDSNGCEPPSYQDPHIIGAIVAHGFDAIINSGDKTLRAKSLEAWLGQLNTKWPELVQLTPAAFLEQSIWSFVSTAGQLSANGKLGAGQCAAVARVFPVYAKARANEFAALGCL